MVIDVIIADDHPTIIAGVVCILGSVKAIRIAGTANNPDELVKLLETKPCDVLVSDYMMPNGTIGDGFEMFSWLRRRYPDLRIVAFTVIDSPAIARQLTQIGVRACINKSVDPSYLIAAIRTAYTDDASCSRRAVCGTWMQEPVVNGLGLCMGLSKPEVRVIQLYATGMSTVEIARKLNRSRHTIDALKAEAMRKLGIADDAELLSYAFKVGFHGAVH